MCVGKFILFIIIEVRSGEVNSNIHTITQYGIRPSFLVLVEKVYVRMTRGHLH